MEELGNCNAYSTLPAVLYSLTKTIIVVNGNKWAPLTETQIETIILEKNWEKTITKIPKTITKRKYF